MSNSQRHKWIPLALLACLAVAACGEQATRGAVPRGPSKEDVLRQRIARDPTDVSARLELANHFFDTQRRLQAIVLYQAVLEKRPDDPNIRTDFGTCLFGAHRNAEARTEYERVIREHPDHVGAVFNLAILEDTEGRPAEAVRLWERAATLTDDPRVVDQAQQMAARARQKVESRSVKSP